MSPNTIFAVDASRTTVKQRTGTETYSLGLITALLQLETPHLWRLYFRDQPPEGILPQNTRVEHHVIPIPRLWSHLRLAWAVTRRAPDGLFIPAHVHPLFCRIPTVVTVHDLGYLHFPDSHPWHQRAYLDWATRHSAHRSVHVISDSQATKADLIKYYHLTPDKISVVYPGFDAKPFANARRMERRHDLPGTYLLHVGTLQPRKNIVALLEALAALRNHPSDPTLVCVGRPGWKDMDIRKQVKHLGLEMHVRFLDYVSENELAGLYAHATAYVSPSLYEGFGFTPLEAMASGTPVVCSDGGSLPEVVGDAALIAPAQDTDALIKAILRVLPGGSDELRKNLVIRGYEQINRFSWSHAAEQTLAILEHAFGVKGQASGKEPAAKGPALSSCNILSIPVHDVTFSETLDWFREAIASTVSHQVCTVNPEFVMAAQKNEGFQRVLQSAELCLPDGQGLLWAAKLRGARLRERVPGSTLIWRLAERASVNGWRLYFLGASEGVAVRAAKILESSFKGLLVVGTHSGTPHVNDAPGIIKRVRAAKPDVLLVAYGAPQQDLWIDRYRSELNVPVMMGVGGSFDFVVGAARRAPEWVQSLGMEWLHRLIMQPWRLTRMLILPRFAWATLTRRDAVYKDIIRD